ncbi:uncharacterized protein [Henckelia pumila]|uniref:uncharacterized protein n=1 Tax=Henckelia pumila TaxID=405737 RepID=UPI003C6E37A8
MKRIFLKKYFPASRAANIRKEIYGIKQLTGESLHEYWERSMLDAASEGVFEDKTPVQERNMIENMATNSQQFGTNRNDHAPRKNNELATAVNRLEALNSSSLPSQTVVNPKENVSAITLRSGKELKVSEELVKEPVKNDGEASKEEAPREKHKLKGCQKVELGEQVYAVIQRKVPKKCKDPGPLNKTEIVIQMADRSTIYPRGLLEDVLVPVDNLVFPADFYVLDMKNNDLNSPILLGRPFLKTSKSIIDVNNGTLTMEFDREVVKFHIFDTLQIPDCESVVNNLDVINHLSQEHKKVPRKSKQRKKILKITAKLRKGVKVVCFGGCMDVIMEQEKC